MNDDEPVLLHAEGHVLHITLNRPRALNALTHTMVRAIDEALTGAADDDAVTAVVISGAGERGLCSRRRHPLDLRGRPCGPPRLRGLLA